MFNRAAARDFFSAERDLDLSRGFCNDGERDFWRLDRETRLRDRERRDFVWLRDRERRDAVRRDNDGERRDCKVRLRRDSRLRDRDADLFDSFDFAWWLLDLQCPCPSPPSLPFRGHSPSKSGEVSWQSSPLECNHFHIHLFVPCHLSRGDKSKVPVDDSQWHSTVKKVCAKSSFKIQDRKGMPVRKKIEASAGW